MRSNLKGMQRSIMAQAVRGCFVVGGMIYRAHDANGGTAKGKDPITALTMAPYRIAAAMTLTEAEHAGRTGVFDIAAGVAVTLPAATGSGARYSFFVKTTVTSLGDVVKVANAIDVMAGTVFGLQDGGDSVEGWETASTSDTITLDGSTKGGILGDYIEVQDVASGLFRVTGHITQTGTQATPFSASVS